MASLFKWARKDDVSQSSGAPESSEPSGSVALSSKVLPRLLAALGHAPSPVLIDLGPVVGANVSFFGEQLACKIFVEDLFAERETHAKRGTLEALAGALTSRVGLGPGTVDGVLCWDFFEYLDNPAAHALAGSLVRVLKPGGVLHGFFGGAPGTLSSYTRYAVEGPGTLRLRQVPATPTPRHVRVVRDLNKLFEGLVTVESVLLKNNTRETLFRKAT